MHHVPTKHEKMSPFSALTKTSPTQSQMKNDNDEDTRFTACSSVTEDQSNAVMYEVSWEKDVK